MAAPNVSEILTTTLESRTRTLADNVSKNNALLFRLRERGNVKPFSGGATIRHEISYSGNTTYTRYSGWDPIDISPSEVISAAEYPIKQAAISVSISGLEQLQNSSKEQMIDLMEGRIQNAEQEFMNQLSADVYSDGSASGGKQIGGLQLLVADDPSTGTVGGINRANWDFWRNQVYDFSANTVTPSSETITAAMNKLYLSLVRNADRPDLVVADNTYFTYYWESLQAIQRITNTNMATAGFTNLKYLDMDVVYDGGFGGSAPSEHMWMLNTRHLFFRPHSQRNVVLLPGERMTVNQDGHVRFIAFAGNMAMDNASLQGVIHA